MFYSPISEFKVNKYKLLIHFKIKPLAITFHNHYNKYLFIHGLELSNKNPPLFYVSILKYPYILTLLGTCFLKFGSIRNIAITLLELY
jgi:hypothetical protein